MCGITIAQCLNCKREHCIHDGVVKDTDQAARWRKNRRKYYYTHREEVLEKQREYDRRKKHERRRDSE